MNKLKYMQSAQLALQAASMAIVEARRNQGGLTDGLRRFLRRLSWLSGAVNGMYRLLLPLCFLIIHNYQLSMLSCENAGSRVSYRGRKRKNATAFFRFSFLTNTRPYLRSFVKEKRSGLDKASQIWHARQDVLSLLTLCLGSCLASRRPARGAEQVTRTALDTWASLPDCEVSHAH